MAHGSESPQKIPMVVTGHTDPIETLMRLHSACHRHGTMGANLTGFRQRQRCAGEPCRVPCQRTCCRSPALNFAVIQTPPSPPLLARAQLGCRASPNASSHTALLHLLWRDNVVCDITYRYRERSKSGVGQKIECRPRGKEGKNEKKTKKKSDDKAARRALATGF